MRRKPRFTAVTLGLVAFGCALGLPEAVGTELGAAARISGLSRSAIWARWNALRGDAYELDRLERFVDAGSAPECDKSALIDYAGSEVRYHGKVLVQPAFRDRLQRFERVLVETAEHIYGRKPRRIRHYGAFNCRLSRNRSRRVSEHAFGNAIDVVGFDFGPASKSEPLKPGLPKRLARAFQVRVERHWHAADREIDRVHGRFLRELTDRLRERRDIFRSMIGPSHPTHRDHFHFDVSPWRYVRL